MPPPKDKQLDAYDSSYSETTEEQWEKKSPSKGEREKTATRREKRSRMLLTPFLPYHQGKDGFALEKKGGPMLNTLFFMKGLWLWWLPLHPLLVVVASFAPFGGGGVCPCLVEVVVCWEWCGCPCRVCWWWVVSPFGGGSLCLCLLCWWLLVPVLTIRLEQKKERAHNHPRERA